MQARNQRWRSNDCGFERQRTARNRRFVVVKLLSVIIS